MTFAHKAVRFCFAAIFAPLLFLGAETEAAPEQAPVQPTKTAPVEDTAIQQLSMEFRHPVADGTLMRMICLIDTPPASVSSSARSMQTDAFKTSPSTMSHGRMRAKQTFVRCSARTISPRRTTMVHVRRR